ncbi:MAG TPA: AIR synthase related protein [Saprospiraceae bacterium]|nr:AIR synthase related protein [Saprospiraceae bacterium]
MSKRYQSLGVSAGKEEVHKAIRNLDKGLFPLAFCKVLPDLVARDPEFVNFIHADTAGTKTSLAFLDWMESQTPGVWANIAQDALVMNLDDLACVGCLNDIVVSSTIGRNKHLIPGQVIEEIIEGTQSFILRMKEFGIRIHSGGGETADVGDIVRTIDVGITAFGRMHRDHLVINDIKPGQCIVGLASSGQAGYESEYNSGIGSNGLTAARHDLLHKSYQEVGDSYAPQTPVDFIYTGPYKLSDSVSIEGRSYRIGALLLSPTRTYLPVLQEVLGKFSSEVKGIIHCTGGAQTKVKKFIRSVRVVKNNFFDCPPVFELLKRHSLCSPEELYEVYNMGHRMEIYTDESTAAKIVDISRTYGIDARCIGHVEASDKEEVLLDSPMGQFIYQ